MRQIKFRGWDFKMKLMRQWDWFDHEEVGIMLVNEYIYIPMQWTGLLDKNGVEIFEGDIAEITYNFGEAGYTEIGVMEFNQKYAQFGFLAKDSLLEQDYENMTVKVIGNVWENPDLLTKGVKE